MASAKEIPPGGEGSISVTFSTKNRRGLNAKQVRVACNDPKQPTVNLKLQARLEAIVDFDPAFADFGTVMWNEGATRQIKLIGREAASVKVVSIEPFGRPENQPGASAREEMLTVRLVEAGDDGGQIIEVSIKPGSQPTILRDIYEVKTDHPKAASLHLKVSGKIRGPLDWRPERLYFSNLEPEVPQKRSILVSGSKGQTAEITGVVTPHESLSAEFGRLDNGDYEVILTCNGNVEKDVEMTSVLIRTSNPEFPEIEVAVGLYKKRDPTRRQPQKPRNAAQPLSGGATRPTTKKGGP